MGDDCAPHARVPDFGDVLNNLWSGLLFQEVPRIYENFQAVVSRHGDERNSEYPRSAQGERRQRRHREQDLTYKT
jgi:hypothetical protein